MKKFKTFLITIISATVCALLCFGLLTDRPLYDLAVAFVLFCISFYLLVYAVVDFVEVVKSKKKIKTSENKVRIKVTYTDPDLILSEPHTRLFTEDNLSLCVQKALRYARSIGVQIKSMEQLTTEE
jgi:membrane protein implicated in regulation of membrane protease activity